MKNTEAYKEGTLGRMLVPHLDVKLFLILLKNIFIYKSLPLNIS